MVLNAVAAGRVVARYRDPPRSIEHQGNRVSPYLQNLTQIRVGVREKWRLTSIIRHLHSLLCSHYW